MWIILHLFFLLSPQQKSLVAMARQGDMIAADQLVTDICAMPGEARQKAATQVRKRIKGKKSKAVEMLNTGLDKCAPLGKGTAAVAVKQAPDDAKSAPRRRGLVGRTVAIPGTAVKDAKASEHQGRRRPISAVAASADKAKPVKNAKAPEKKSPHKKKHLADKKQVAKKTQSKKSPSAIVKRAEKKGPVDRAAAKNKSLASADALPDGDLDASSPTETRRRLVGAHDDKGEQSLPAQGSLVANAAQDRPTRMADVDRNLMLKRAMTYYGVGGGFVAVATVSYIGAVMALGNGVFQQMQLKTPDAGSALQTPDGRTEQDVYDAQVAAIWTGAGIVCALAAVTATAELIAGFVLFAQGEAALE